MTPSRQAKETTIRLNLDVENKMTRHRTTFIRQAVCGLLLLFMAAVATAGSSEKAEPVTHQITGLFSADRVQDLHDAVKLLPGIELVSIDFDKAEAAFVYDPKETFPDATPEQVVERFDNLLQQASQRTFGVKPLCAIPRDQLKFIEIPAAGLDCRGCNLAAYEAIYRLDGVEQATANFKDGLVTAWIDPNKTHRAAVEDALTKRKVKLRVP